MDNSILLNSSVSDEDPTAEFYNDKVPSIDGFNKIKDEDKLRAFKELLSSAPEDDYLRHLVFTILKLSSISEQSPEAKTIAQELFKEAFEYGKNKDRVNYEFKVQTVSNLFSFLDQKHQKLLPHPTRAAEVGRKAVQAKIQRRIMPLSSRECHQHERPTR